eukprot:c15839_g1_i1 orf=1785-3449(-)
MANMKGYCEFRSVVHKLQFLLAGLYLVFAKADVYLVTVEGDAVVGMVPKISGKPSNNPVDQKLVISSQAAKAYKVFLESQHDMLLKSIFKTKSYSKLYSYHHVVNGFAVQISSEQADALQKSPGVLRVERDWQLRRMTTHTPDFLGLPTGIWHIEGGAECAGEGVVIGIIDTGIDPTHASFSARVFPPYLPINGFNGSCEIGMAHPYDSFCNGKIVGARHFSAAAEAAGAFNSSTDFASPLDGDGHGSHTASTAAGNHGVPVVVDGFYFGNASGMAPRARIAVYKALYRFFGGFVADVVAAIDQAVEDGVDVLNLSVGPSSPPLNRQTFLNVFDVALLSAVKAGILVVQAAGNGGPYPRSITSFSPWILSVAAGLDDRSYANWILLNNGDKLLGAGLSPPTPGDGFYSMVLAEDALAESSNLFFNPTSCQQPEAFNRTITQGKILICTYSFSFVFGQSTLKQVSQTTQNLSAVGFVMVVNSELPGTKFNPVPITVPGIVITNLADSQVSTEFLSQCCSILSGRVYAMARSALPMCGRSIPETQDKEVDILYMLA